MIYGVTGMWGANKLGIIKYRIKNIFDCHYLVIYIGCIFG